jgi:hypothetical protein
MSIAMEQSALGLIQTDNNVDKLKVEHAQEYVFGEKYLGERIELRIYSTISTVTHKPRSTGEDAIRVLLYDTKRQKIVDKAKRTHRTKNWRENLQKKVERMKQKARQIRRCSCGGVLVPRDGFLGCTKYPECTITENLKVGK